MSKSKSFKCGLTEAIEKEIGIKTRVHITACKTCGSRKKCKIYLKKRDKKWDTLLAGMTGIISIDIKDHWRNTVNKIYGKGFGIG